MPLKILNKIFNYHFPPKALMIIDCLLVLGALNFYKIVDNTQLLTLTNFLEIVFSFLIVIAGIFCGVYSSKTRYFNFIDFFSLGGLIIFFSLVYIIISNKYSLQLFIVIFFLLSIAIFPTRILSKAFFAYSRKSNRNAIILFGAGDRGISFKRSLYSSGQFHVVGFVDENTMLQGRNVDGVKIYGLGQDLLNCTRKNNVKKIIFTTNKIQSDRFKFFVDYFQKLGIKPYKLPNNNYESIETKSSFKIEEIKVEDLLFRDAIEVNSAILKSFFSNKRVLVTGGAGSIGSELVRQLIDVSAKKIVVVDLNETALFNLQGELYEEKNVSYHLINVLDEKNMSDLFESNQFDFVFHAAAYKHVSIIESNPIAGLYNNVLGTYRVGCLAGKYGVSKFILISTDKAVNPSNIMGASKRFCELITNKISLEFANTSYVTTRFGNVLGSNGSVIPIFKSQIENGGPITLTHPEIVRYFMSIPEACLLVLEACRIGSTNQILIFDMGKPVKILDLALNMITLSGNVPYTDIDIKIIGLRPGEKLYEEILYSNEKLLKSPHPNLYISEKKDLNSNEIVLIRKLLDNLKHNSNTDVNEIVKDLKKLIPEFKSNNSQYSQFD